MSKAVPILLVTILIVPLYVFALQSQLQYSFQIQPRGCSITPNIWALGNVTSGLSYPSPQFTVSNPASVSRTLNMTYTITPLGIATITWGFEGHVLGGKASMNVTFTFIAGIVANATKGSGVISVNCL